MYACQVFIFALRNILARVWRLLCKFSFFRDARIFFADCFWSRHKSETSEGECYLCAFYFRTEVLVRVIPRHQSNWNCANLFSNGVVPYRSHFVFIPMSTIAVSFNIKQTWILANYGCLFRGITRTPCSDFVVNGKSNLRPTLPRILHLPKGLPSRTLKASLMNSRIAIHAQNAPKDATTLRPHPWRLRSRRTPRNIVTLRALLQNSMG